MQLDDPAPGMRSKGPGWNRGHAAEGTVLCCAVLCCAVGPQKADHVRYWHHHRVGHDLSASNMRSFTLPTSQAHGPLTNGRVDQELLSALLV